MYVHGGICEGSFWPDCLCFIPPTPIIAQTASAPLPHPCSFHIQKLFIYQPAACHLFLSFAFNSIFTMTQHVGIAMRGSRKWVENSYWWLTMVGRKISVTNKSGEMQQPPNCDTDDELWMHSRVVSVEGSVCHCGWEAAMASQQLRSSQPYRSSLQELPAMRTTVP